MNKKIKIKWSFLLLQPTDVAVRIKQIRIGHFAVPSGPAALLIEGLHGFGYGIMDDEAHVRFIDAHSESYGGHDHVETVLHPLALNNFPNLK